MSLKEGGGLERDFSLGVLVASITFLAEWECAGRKVGVEKGGLRTDFGSITLNFEG